MSVIVFKPEDFAEDQPYVDYKSHRSAKIANKLFQEWLEKQPVIMGEKIKSTGAFIWTDPQHTFPAEPYYVLGATHQAHLVQIEPVQKKCEKHEPVTELRNGVTSGTITPGKFGYSFFEKDKWFCSKCNVELVAEWRAK